MSNDNGKSHAEYLALLGSKFCPNCTLQKTAGVSLLQCVAIASLRTTCLKTDYTLGHAFARSYVVRDGYEIDDPNRYNFDLISYEELFDILRANA